MSLFCQIHSSFWHLVFMHRFVRSCLFLQMWLKALHRLQAQEFFREEYSCSLRLPIRLCLALRLWMSGISWIGCLAGTNLDRYSGRIETIPIELLYRYLEYQYIVRSIVRDSWSLHHLSQEMVYSHCGNRFLGSFFTDCSFEGGKGKAQSLKSEAERMRIYFWVWPSPPFRRVWKNRTSCFHASPMCHRNFVVASTIRWIWTTSFWGDIGFESNSLGTIRNGPSGRAIECLRHRLLVTFETAPCTALVIGFELTDEINIIEEQLCIRLGCARRKFFPSFRIMVGEIR